MITVRQPTVGSAADVVQFAVPHRWDVTPKQAVAIQQTLRHRVIVRDDIASVTRVAGVDVGFENGGAVTRAAVAILSFPDLVELYSQVVRVPTVFPYVPGLLSFREVPAVLAALEQVPLLPDLILCDGQGIAHPRRFGLACHLGVVTGLATIGVAKSRLTGSLGTVPENKGEWTALRDGDEIIGAVLRTRAGVKPLFVSVGHRVTLATAVAYVMACVTRYRLPETTRCAHHLASPGER
jgi:deoxyribonuclease V